MSLSSLLSIARSALSAQQRAVDVAGHNIANASTEGYTRQRLRLIPATPLRNAKGFLGRGVRVDGIERSRSRFLDATVRRESAALAQFSTLRQSLAEVEDVLGEPSDFGLAASMDAFWSAWGDLANNPLNGAVRAVVRSQGRQLTDQFNRMANRLDAIRGQTFESLRSDIDDVNRMTVRLAALNRQIVASGGAGANAPDLLDVRDLLLDKLSELLPIQVVQNEDGSVRVFGGEILLVDGMLIRPLAVTTTPSGAVAIATELSTVKAASGRVAAHLDLLNSAISTVSGQLDSLAAAIVSEVNTLHNGGATLAGAPAGDFFSATGVTAASITLAVQIDQSPDNIAAGTGSGPGDGSVALNMAALRDVRVSSLGDLTIGDFYTSVVATLGQEVREAEGFASAQDALVANAKVRRSSMSDVSIDEEMISIIMHQQAFAAAARLVSVADEMIQEVLRMV